MAGRTTKMASVRMTNEVNYQSSFSRCLIDCTNRAKESVGDLICGLEGPQMVGFERKGRSALPEHTVDAVS
jgi:hypothetical protein